MKCTAVALHLYVSSRFNTIPNSSRYMCLSNTAERPLGVAVSVSLLLLERGYELVDRTLAVGRLLGFLVTGARL
jgi:hypothetical protein